jgi:hypothetical protein
MRLKKEFFESLLFVIGSLFTCALVLLSAQYQSSIKVSLPTLSDGIESLRTSIAAIEFGAEALDIPLDLSSLPDSLPNSLADLWLQPNVEQLHETAAMNLLPPAYSSEDELISIEAAASEQVALLLARIEATLSPIEPATCESPLPELPSSLQFLAIARNWTHD